MESDKHTNRKKLLEDISKDLTTLSRDIKDVRSDVHYIKTYLATKEKVLQDLADQKQKEQQKQEGSGGWFWT